jgi:hypothetical protein
LRAWLLDLWRKFVRVVDKYAAWVITAITAITLCAMPPPPPTPAYSMLQPASQMASITASPLQDFRKTTHYRIQKARSNFVPLAGQGMIWLRLGTMSFETCLAQLAASYRLSEATGRYAQRKSSMFGWAVCCL